MGGQDGLALMVAGGGITLRPFSISCTVPVLVKLQSSLETAGIEFLNHGKPGVRLAMQVQ